MDHVDWEDPAELYAALSGLHSKINELSAHWDSLKQHLKAEELLAYCAQCSAGYKESVTKYIHMEAWCKKLLLKMKELEADA